MNVQTDGNYQEAQARFLEQLRPQYVSKGYDFVVHPAQSDLPAFLSWYVPDAIARKADSKIAIEVLTRAPRSHQPSIQRIRELFEGHSDWQFVVAYTGGDAFERLAVSDKKTILGKVDEARKLSINGHLSAAFLVAWSLLEAALNLVKPHAEQRPRKPGTVIQTLAMDGFIPPELEASLRPLIEQRNRLVHGDLSIEPSLSEVDLILNAVGTTLADA